MAIIDDTQSLKPDLPADNRALEPSGEAETDYVLKDDQSSCWIQVDGISLWIRRIVNEDKLNSVRVDACKSSEEAMAAIASLEVTMPDQFDEDVDDGYYGEDDAIEDEPAENPDGLGLYDRDRY